MKHNDYWSLLCLLFYPLTMLIFVFSVVAIYKQIISLLKSKWDVTCLRLDVILLFLLLFTIFSISYSAIRLNIPNMVGRYLYFCNTVIAILWVQNIFIYFKKDTSKFISWVILCIVILLNISYIVSIWSEINVFSWIPISYSV